MFDKEYAGSEKVRHLLKHLCRHAAEADRFHKMKTEVHEQLHKARRTALESVDMQQIEAEFLKLEAKLEQVLKWEQHADQFLKEDSESSERLQARMDEMEKRIQLLEQRRQQHRIVHTGILKEHLKILEQKYEALQKTVPKDDVERLASRISQIKMKMLRPV